MHTRRKLTAGYRE